MKINNQSEFLDYMLTKHWDDHPTHLIERRDNLIKRDVTPPYSDIKSFIYYHCYHGEIDSNKIKTIHKTIMEPLISEPADDIQIREVVVWCKNGQSNGILFCSYQNFIEGLKDGEHVDYSLFRWGDPTDDSSPMGGKPT